MPISVRYVIQSTVILFATALLVLAVIVGTTIWLSERSSVLFAEVNAARDVRSSAVEAQRALQTAESGQRGYLYTGNQVYLASYSPARALALARFDALREGLQGYPELSAAIGRLGDVLTEKFAEMDETIALKQARDDIQAMALVRSNRGKLLMDEANVFFTGAILAAEGRLSAALAEQQGNSSWLRLVSIVGGGLILLVVSAALVTIIRYTAELRGTRDALATTNAQLEQRVEARTADLQRARDRAELLLAEVNHRVANSLTLVSSLVGLQANVLTDKAAKDALSETQARINAIALVHRRLYSGSDVTSVDLAEYLPSVLAQFDGAQAITIHGKFEPLALGTDASISLGVILTEWVTNALKYAYPDGQGEVWVRLEKSAPDEARLTVEDSGVGRDLNAAAKGTGLGTRIVKAMATTLQASVDYARKDPGTRASLTFALKAAPEHM